MGQVNLKKGDVIDVTEDIKNAWMSDELVVRTGPKQGDPVWVKVLENRDWKPAKYITYYAPTEMHVVIENGTLSWFSYMTTEDPYALKYTLTPKEARIECAKGNKVRGDKYLSTALSFWVDGEGIGIESDICKWSKTFDLDQDQMYAIVEE